MIPDTGKTVLSVMEKDYSVRVIRLFDVVHQASAENKYMLLQNGVNIELQETDDAVYSNEKWVCFIPNQFIANLVKYRRAQRFSFLSISMILFIRCRADALYFLQFCKSFVRKLDMNRNRVRLQ